MFCASRLLADEVIHVDVDYIITPPTNQTMTALFSQVLRPGIANSTAALGLAMDAKYRNSTIRLVSHGLSLHVLQPWQAQHQCRSCECTSVMPIVNPRIRRRVPQASASLSRATRHGTHAWQMLPEQPGSKWTRGMPLLQLHAYNYMDLYDLLVAALAMRHVLTGLGMVCTAAAAAAAVGH